MITYRQSDLTILAKRENNLLRPYLIVNPLQGKHIPVNPHKAIELFNELASRVYERYMNNKLLVIGFAETATAIGSAIAVSCPNGCTYIQTTREHYEGEYYLYFSEIHSHASQQKLITSQNLYEALEAADYVLFAEDEVTTGDTIKNIIHALDQFYPMLTLKYGIASILNGMSDKRILEFEQAGIYCTYIMRNIADSYDTILSQYSYPANLMRLPKYDNISYKNKSVNMQINPRSITIADEYKKACSYFSSVILKDLENDKNISSLLVLGSEEFMYPALITADVLMKTKHYDSVYFHASTRSPILPSYEERYPLNIRYELESLYASDRTIYIYNLKKYDKAIIIHDSHNLNDKGIITLCSALSEQGISDITIYHWVVCDEYAK